MSDDMWRDDVWLLLRLLTVILASAFALGFWAGRCSA